MQYVGIDVGGTFTDVISYDEREKGLRVNKVLTTKENIEEGVLRGLEHMGIEPRQVGLVSHATTIATNALLTHSGLANTALITNRGFRDVLEIGRQRRADLYDLETKRPPPLVRRRDRFTVGGRILADGTEFEPISPPEVRAVAKKIVAAGYESVVVGFLNSYVNPRHEKATLETLRAAGFRGHADLSSEVNKEYREFERFSTAVVNAAIAPLVSRYLGNLAASLRRGGFEPPLYVMNSDGSSSTVGQASKYPVLMIESGPAAGVLAAKNLARSLGLGRILTFDMGGTTAKAGAVVDYEPDVAYEFEAAGTSHSGRSIKGSGYAVRAPFIDLAEVSAGGGTIAYLDDAGSLKVGPQSAGSDPGPAAYGRGGKFPTITDANVVLGRINPSSILGARMKIWKDEAIASLKEFVAEGLRIGVEEAARGIVKIANNQMARAISIVSVERGRDPRDYTMIAFGGAGPIHGCDLAEELGISRILLPPHAGLFSAYGLLAADVQRNYVRPVMEFAPNTNLEETFAELEAKAGVELSEDGIETSRLRFFRTVEARYLGQSYGIIVPYLAKGTKALQNEFRERHKSLYGYFSDDQVEIVSAKLRVTIPTRKPRLSTKSTKEEGPRRIRSFSRASAKNKGKRRAWFANGRYDAPVFVREELETGFATEGPCIVEEYDSTAIINPGWSVESDDSSNLIARRIAAKRGSERRGM